MKTYKFLIFSVVTVLMAITNVSCADYEDDIDSLKDRVTILENLVDRVNTDINTLQTLVEAMQTGDVITRVDTLYTADRVLRGYKFYFMTHDPVEILNGVDGASGTDAVTPLFAIEADDQGKYCWKVSYDGGQTYSWLLDEQGNTIVAVGKDGENGEDGRSVTPLIRISDNGIWQVSYDEGATWKDLTDPVTGVPLSAKGRDGKDAEKTFKEVNIHYASDGVTQTGWTFVMNNGDTFTIDQPVMAKSVVITKNGVSVQSDIYVPVNETFQLEATIEPESVSYRDIFWYVHEGNTADVQIFSPNAATTMVRMLTAGKTVKLRAVARCSEWGQPLVFAEVTISSPN